MSPNPKHNGSKSKGLLNVWQGAALLTADCLGTGILALSKDVHVLGVWLGIGFIVLNLPINWYAGSILSDSAAYVEKRQRNYSEKSQSETRGILQEENEPTGIINYSSIENESHCEEEEDGVDSLTFDFIGITSALFYNEKATKFVMILFYTNIFLVLGNYILVMSHAVSSLFGGLCVPQAGILASILMFVVSQLRTMAKLGRTATIVSLAALFIVVVQCVYFVNQRDDRHIVDNDKETNLLNKLSCTGSIGFAVGSQKLFLNIRHEIANRDSAPKSLALSLCGFGAFYIATVLLSGPNPPAFLFDAIPHGFHSRLAGLFLWIHVAVSYAINSQAICASMDRLFFRRFSGVEDDAARWMVLTGVLAISAFLVANAIPFFEDLVALIGALTSVPLTLLLPAVFHRKVVGAAAFWPSTSDIGSYLLLVFSILFFISALVGSVYSTAIDWEEHLGGFFSCP